ncbi:MAG: hypothetical protein H0V30_13855 [Chitinophagaceae bacterium]|nr:hypothetical protein [Chitinophagaceae bacterium]
MKNELNRDLLVLFKNQFLSEQAFEQEVEGLNSLLIKVENPNAFCMAHELVCRNQISCKPLKILKACRHFNLPAFYFLINKN